MFTLEQAYREFMADKEFRQTMGEMSHKTLLWYKWQLEPFVSQHADSSFDSITAQMIRAYLMARVTGAPFKGGRVRTDKQRSKETAYGAFKALRAFFRWITREYDLDERANPMRKVSMKKPAHPDGLKGIALDDVRRLLQATGEGTTGIRDRAIVLFLIDTGCRANGLISLTLDHLDVAGRRATVIEKGNRERIVPFTEQTAHQLEEWLRVRPPLSKAVFCCTGKKNHGQPLTYFGLREALRRLGKKAGVEGIHNLHAFRHTVGRELMKRSGNPAAVQKLLGHSTPTVTLQFYAQHSIEDVADVQRNSGLMDDLLESEE